MIYLEARRCDWRETCASEVSIRKSSCRLFSIFTALSLFLHYLFHYFRVLSIMVEQMESNVSSGSGSTETTVKISFGVKRKEVAKLITPTTEVTAGIDPVFIL